MQKPLIHIVIPAYNEAPRIETSMHALIAHLRDSAFPYPYRITIVDNASSDATPACAAHLVVAYPQVVFSLRMEEKGKGGAVRCGWQEWGDVLVFMDADLSSDLDYLKPLVDAIVVSDGDLSIGNRLGPTSKIYNRRMLRGFMSHVYNWIMRVVFRTGITDHQCGFKAIRREAYQKIAPHLIDTGWFFDTELLVVAKRFGYSIASIDIRWHDNHQSKVSVVGTSLAMARAVYAFQKRLPTITGMARSSDQGLVLIDQVRRFLLSGAIAAAVNLAVFWLLLDIVHLQYVLDVIYTAVLVFFVSFGLQKWWTFDDRDARHVPVQLPLFMLSALATTLANIVLIFLLVSVFHIWPVPAQVFTLALIATVNFSVYKFLIFKR